MVQLLGVSTVIFVLVAAAPQPLQPLLRTTTQKPPVAFGSCFAAAQDKAAQPWAYMPIGEGGTFTNYGAEGSGGAYWLTVRGSAHRAEIRLFGDEAARPSASLMKAVDQCR